MKSPRPTQILVAVLLMMFCSMVVSAGDEPTRVEVRKAAFETFPGAEEVQPEGFERKIFLAADAEFTNSDFASVKAILDPRGEPGLELILTEAAALRMEQLTGEWIGKPLAILINGEVVLAPVVQAVLGERMIVNGRFTAEEAEQLAAQFH